jgi:hypothetical protein
MKRTTQMQKEKCPGNILALSQNYNFLAIQIG